MDIYRAIYRAIYDGLKDRSFLLNLILGLALAALLTDLLAVFSGLDTAPPQAPDGYRTFCHVPAWYPFPLYFLIVYLVVKQSWYGFTDAWRSLPDTRVMQAKDEAVNKKYDPGNNKWKETLEDLLAGFGAWRKYLLIPLSIVAGAFCMYLDSDRERDTMMAALFSGKTDTEVHYKGTQTTFSGQVARACEDPDFMNKWLWVRLGELGTNATDACQLEQDGKTNKPKNTTREKKFAERVDNVKKRLGSGADRFVAPDCRQWLPVLLMHLEDMVLISFGWLILFQCIAHALFFWNFEKLKAAEIDGNRLCLKLNSRSPLGEFGLEHWNHALNNLYWYFSAALLIPFLSRVSQRDLTDLDPSQQLLQYIIPLLVATPMITTILARQSRLPACWKELAFSDAESHLSQRLWPVDRNWSSKLGVLLAFVLLSISFGINLSALL